MSAGINPTRSAAVSASAGSGKTWLLVTRLVRILLDGAEPNQILALTFTNKAAGEMQQRLRERLESFAQCDEALLDEQLALHGLETNPEIRDRARGLYEKLIRSPHPVRTATFHAFCQEILQRFAIDAGVAPGFDLLEDGTAEIETAWQQLLTEASAAPDSEMASTLAFLMAEVSSLDSLQSSLHSMLAHRLDWWVYCEGRESETLERQLAADFADEGKPAPRNKKTILQELFNHPLLNECLATYAAGLRTFGAVQKATNSLAALAEARDESQEHEARFDKLRAALLVQAGTPQKYDNKSNRKKLVSGLGDGADEQFFAAQTLAADLVLQAIESILRFDNWQLNIHWRRMGTRFIEHYQLIKRQQRQLDFTDLEWRTWQLLQDPELGHWIQYKLDAGISHLLVDEFQDTNPTQWGLLQPLLAEIMAGDPERSRSAFIVGDEKQSIYAFRRADPRLLDTAAQWLQSQSDTEPVTLARSWRSSDAIMRFTNQLFGDDGPMPMENFPAHETVKTERWGAATLLPLIEPEEADETEIVWPTSHGLRDPLSDARPVMLDRRSLAEGEQIAAEIQRLVADQQLINDDTGARPIRYGDIMILLRARSHAAAVEAALQQAGIPFDGTDRNSFAGSLEVQDLITLLTSLVSPWNNLATAQALRSPLFSLPDSALMALGPASESSWLMKLLSTSECPETLQDQAETQRAILLLRRWLPLASQLPVHDLLDRILDEGNVLARYASAYPAHLQARAERNLQALCNLALATDKGRYPSITKFIDACKRHEIKDAGQHPDRVRMLTIHSAKGLEAPVVFLANATQAANNRNAWAGMINWPPGDSRPAHFLLQLPQKRLDSHTAKTVDLNLAINEREDRNLLYVAVTRAKQYLYISGFPAGRRSSKTTWYGAAELALEDQSIDKLGRPCLNSQAAVPKKATAIKSGKNAAPEIQLPASRPIAALTEGFDAEAADQPEQTAEAENSAERGIAIHQLLEWLAQGDSPEQARARVAAKAAFDKQLLDDCMAEACAVIAQPELAWMFTAAKQAWTELPAWSAENNDGKMRVIDRLVDTGDAMWIIDYKTTRVAELSDAARREQAAGHRPQLKRYEELLRPVWPDREWRAAVLFTETRELVEVS